VAALTYIATVLVWKSDHGALINDHNDESGRRAVVRGAAVQRPSDETGRDLRTAALEENFTMMAHSGIRGRIPTPARMPKEKVASSNLTMLPPAPPKVILPRPYHDLYHDLLPPAPPKVILPRPYHDLYHEWSDWAQKGSPHGDALHNPAVALGESGDVRHLPFFAICGAQKAGTTYLRWLLVQHPLLESGDGLHGETRGEPHFFDWGYPSGADTKAAVATKYSRSFHLTRQQFILRNRSVVRSTTKAWNSSTMTRLRLHCFVRSAMRISCLYGMVTSLLLTLISSLGNSQTTIYKRIKLFFDTTPSYMVSGNVPGRLHRILPHIKLIFILRNPTDRYRSELQMEVCRARFVQISSQFHTRGKMAKYLESEAPARDGEAFGRIAASKEPLRRGLYVSSCLWFCP
jgi:hypothetical protein